MHSPSSNNQKKYSVNLICCTSFELTAGHTLKLQTNSKRKLVSDRLAEFQFQLSIRSRFPGLNDSRDKQSIA